MRAAGSFAPASMTPTVSLTAAAARCRAAAGGAPRTTNSAIAATPPVISTLNDMTSWDRLIIRSLLAHHLRQGSGGQQAGSHTPVEGRMIRLQELVEADLKVGLS